MHIWLYILSGIPDVSKIVATEKVDLIEPPFISKIALSKFGDVTLAKVPVDQILIKTLSNDIIHFLTQ